MLHQLYKFHLTRHTFNLPERLIVRMAALNGTAEVGLSPVELFEAYLAQHMRSDACKAAPDFVPYAGGGDGAAVPHWFVGWSPSLSRQLEMNLVIHLRKLITLRFGDCLS